MVNTPIINLAHLPKTCCTPVNDRIPKSAPLNTVENTSRSTRTCQEVLWRMLLKAKAVNWLPSGCCQKALDVPSCVEYVCASACHAPCMWRYWGTWLIKWSKSCWKGLDTASTRGLDTHVFREAERASMTEEGGPCYCTPPGCKSSVMGQRPFGRRNHNVEGWCLH